MASHRSKSLYAIKECSTCGSLYTKDCCSIGSLNDKILVSESNSSPRCARCGTPVDGPSCRGCAFLRKKFDEDLLAYCVENGIFKDFQDTSESSDDNTNVVNALREPCVVNQDPGEKSSQEPPQIDHNCCYECGDSLDGIFCRQCICKSCGKGAHYGYNCPPKVPIISNPEQCNQTINELPQILPIVHPTCNYEAENSFAYDPNPNSFDNSPNFSYPPPQPQFETYLCELCGNNAHYGYDCPPQFPFVYEQEPCYNQNFDDNCFPQNSPSFSQQYLCCAYCGGPHFDYQCQPINETCYPSYDYSDHSQPPQDSVDHQGILQILNKMEEKIEEIIRDGRKKIEDMSIEEIMHEQQLVDREIKGITNDLGIRRFRGEEIDEEYERDCEIRIRKLKQDFNIWGSEVRKKEKAYEDEKYAAACRYMLSVTCDDDDLGFYAVHPNTIHTPVSQNVEPKDSLIMGDGHINTTPETETISVETLVSNPSESDDFSLGECNLFDIDDSYYEKSTSRLAHLALISPKIVEVCVDDDDTDDDDDYDDDVYVDDCVDIEEDGGEIDLDISKIVDISLREKLVESYLLIEKINAFSLSPPIPISPIFCPSSTIPVVDLDLPLEEADVPSFSDDSILRGIESDRDSGEDTTSIDALPLDDSMILSFTFDDEPVMAEVNVFDEINTSELSYPGIGENVVLDEEEDTFTFTTRSFLPFVTYPEVLPASYSTGSEDKIFKPGIFDNDAFKDKSSKELAPSKALLTLDVFDPLHPPLMDFHVTKAFFGFTFSILKIFSKKFVEPGIKNATVYLSSLVWGGFYLLDFLHHCYYPP
ncbi:hypothetical protein Tco_0378323 [Tanacetum coccineum]